MNGARRSLTPFVGKTLFPPRGRFSRVRDERKRGNFPVSPKAPSPHRLESSR
jgi:hypothetical protein